MSLEQLFFDSKQNLVKEAEEFPTPQNVSKEIGIEKSLIL